MPRSNLLRDPNPAPAKFRMPPKNYGLSRRARKTGTMELPPEPLNKSSPCYEFQKRLLLSFAPLKSIEYLGISLGWPTLESPPDLFRKTSRSQTSGTKGSPLLNETTEPTPKGPNRQGNNNAVNAGNGNAMKGSGNSFCCYICYDLLRIPIIIKPCGHVFCWPCLYTWLHCYSRPQKCPRCGILLKNAELILRRGDGLKTDRKSKPFLAAKIPRHPTAQIAPPPPRDK